MYAVTELGKQHETPVKSPPGVAASTPTPEGETPGASSAAPTTPGPTTPTQISTPMSAPVPKLNGTSGGGPSAEMSSDVHVLQQQVAALRAELADTHVRVGHWEECMRQLANSVMLSPEMNDMYKETCKALLQDALSSVEQVQRVVYVDCSFPSVPAEAPRLSLQKWVGMEHSEWDLAWRPSWSVAVAIEGSHYLQFQLMLKVFDIEVAGRMKLAMARDPAFSKISMSFIEPPTLGIKTECSVSWGSTPLPIQEYIGSAVEDYFKSYINETMVAPKSMVIEPSGFQRSSTLTDEDVERAIRAVDLARSLSQSQQ